MNTQHSLISRRQRFSWEQEPKWEWDAKKPCGTTPTMRCVLTGARKSETTRHTQESLQAGCGQRQERVLMRVLARNHRAGIVIITIATAVLITIGVVPMIANTTAAAAVPGQNSMNIPGALSSRLGDNDTVTKTITVGMSPALVAFTPDGNTAYVTNNGSDSVSRIDTATGTVTKTITVGTSPYGVAITPDGNTAYVTNYYSDSVSRIDTATGTVTKTITVGSSPYGVAITPDGITAYVTNNGSNSVSRIDTATGTVTKTITVGTYPYGVAVTPDGNTAYFPNNGSNSVSRIDTATGTVAKTIAVGTSPYGVAITPDGNTAYITNYYSGS